MTELPDVFRFEAGERVGSPRDWRRRRDELQEILLAVEYGHLPPAPPNTDGEELHSHEIKRFGDIRHSQFRLFPAPDQSFWFILDLLLPRGEGPLPVVLNGDGCWRYVSEAVTLEVLRRGYALAQFNRTEIVPDKAPSGDTSGLRRVFPNGDFGALAAWAWGYHRCVDFLRGLPRIDGKRLAVVGHSRGGKASLLAGATDERIALTAANGSGCGGAGCFRLLGPGSETLRDILAKFPYWFSPRLTEYIGQEERLPFDQHYLKALVAPRPLLVTQALGDAWANPTGTWQTHEAAREVYRWLNVEDRIGSHYRQGGHSHDPEDWAAFLDFADWHLQGKPPARRFDAAPAPT